MDEINCVEQDYDKLEIRDKNFYAKRRKTVALIVTPILLVLIAGIIAIIILFWPKEKYFSSIICKYQTVYANQSVELINYSQEDDFSLIIDGIKYNKNRSHIFENVGIHNVVFEFEKKIDHISELFKDNEHLIDADFSKCKIQHIKSMYFMFGNCVNLKNVTFNNETPNLKNMYNMFKGCKSLITVNLNIDTSKVENMYDMFYDSTSLIYLDLSKFNLENLEYSSKMFYNCTNLKEIKFNNNTKTKNLKGMDSMFDSCISLEHINTKIFKDNNLTDFNYVFKDCISLTSIDLSNFESRNIKELKGTFYNCMNLTNINFTNFDTSKVTRMDEMFYNCTSLKNLDISSFHLENLENSKYMFYNCRNLAEIKFNNNTIAKNLTYMNNMFDSCSSLTHINTKIFNYITVCNLNYVFKDCILLQSIDLSNIKIDCIMLYGRLEGTFYNCNNIRIINFTNFVTSKVNTMANMFYNCTSLRSLNLSNVNLNNLRNSSFMFKGCLHLEQIVFNNNASIKELKDMNSMFYDKNI